MPDTIDVGLNISQIVPSSEGVAAARCRLTQQLTQSRARPYFRLVALSCCAATSKVELC